MGANKVRKSGRVVCKDHVIVYGGLFLRDIETADVENFNGVLCERIGRLVRKSKCFSKVKDRLVGVVEMFRFYWNFINAFKRCSSPAKLEGLTDLLWPWHEFFYFKQIFLESVHIKIAL